MNKSSLIVCLAIILVSAVSFAAEPIHLDPFKADGKDRLWVNRGGGWMGITGDHHSHSNVPLWWNSFPGQSGTYKIQIIAGTECDGSPSYAVQMNGNKICSGRFPDAGGGCNDCGVKQQVLTCTNSANITKGAKITLLGSSVYPCGDHGAYTRNKGLLFTLISGSGDPDPTPTPTDPATKITSPKTGDELIAGKEYTLTAEGANVSWSYDANSDGKGKENIGTGLSVKFTVPTDVNDPRTITIYAAGSNGSDQIDCKIAADAVGIARIMTFTTARNSAPTALYSLRGKLIGKAASSQGTSSAHRPGIYLMKTANGASKVCVPVSK